MNNRSQRMHAGRFPLLRQQSLFDNLGCPIKEGSFDLLELDHFFVRLRCHTLLVQHVAAQRRKNPHICVLVLKVRFPSQHKIVAGQYAGLDSKSHFVAVARATASLVPNAPRRTQGLVVPEVGPLALALAHRAACCYCWQATRVSFLLWLPKRYAISALVRGSGAISPISGRSKSSWEWCNLGYFGQVEKFVGVVQSRLFRASQKVRGSGAISAISGKSKSSWEWCNLAYFGQVEKFVGVVQSRLFRVSQKFVGVVQSRLFRASQKTVRELGNFIEP